MRACSTNCLQLRHPNILAFKDSAEVQEKGQTVVYLVTQPVQPLKSVLEELNLQGQHRCVLRGVRRAHGGTPPRDAAALPSAPVPSSATADAASSCTAQEQHLQRRRCSRGGAAAAAPRTRALYCGWSKAARHGGGKRVAHVGMRAADCAPAGTSTWPWASCT